MRVILDRGILGRQSKRVPSHRMDHVKSLHPLYSRNHIPNRVVAHVPHVQRPRRVRQHLQHIIFWLFRVGFRFKYAVFIPPLLPLRLNLLRLVVPHAVPVPFGVRSALSVFREGPPLYARPNPILIPAIPASLACRTPECQSLSSSTSIHSSLSGHLIVSAHLLYFFAFSRYFFFFLSPANVAS